MSAGIGFATYDAGGSREWMMRSGINFDAQVVILLPFFHEANRLRGFASALMRRLADRGIGAVLPDLPGCGESLQPLPQSLDRWRKAASAAIAETGARASLAIRSGALIDSVMPPDCRWRLSPATGASLTRDLTRSRLVEEREAGRGDGEEAITSRARRNATRLAGYALSPGLFMALEAAHLENEAARTLRLVGDDRPADARMPGPMLWRQVEPVTDDAFAEAIVADFFDWTVACAIF